MNNGFLQEFGHAMQFSNGYRHPDAYHHESVVPRSFANKNGGGGSAVKTVYTESLVYQGNRAFSHNGSGDQKGRAVKQSTSSLEKFLNTKKTTLQVLRPKDIQPSSYPLPFVSPLEKKKMAAKKVEKEIYSRKVFVGGLPIDIREEEVYNTFRPYGKVLVDWPRRQEALKDGGRSMSGYVFLVFEEEECVGRLIGDCYEHSGKFYLCVTSPTMHKKPVQVRPWYLSDADYMLDPQLPLDSRLTVFIGGVPRPTKAIDIAEALNRYYGNVAYVGVDTDPELRYPKGCARVTFTGAKGYIAAISGRYVYLNHADVEKRVEIKPYLMEEQMCDECAGNKCHGRYAPYYCGHESCMQYYCEACWDSMHVGETSHCPIVRMGEQTKVLKHPPHHNSNNNNRSRGRPYFRG